METDDKIETRGAECLAFEESIPDFAALMKEDGTLEFVRCFALVETGLAPPPQGRAGIPLDHEQRSFDTAEFPQGFGQLDTSNYRCSRPAGIATSAVTVYSVA